MAQRQVRQRQLLYVSDSVDADYDLDTAIDLDRRSSRLLVEAMVVMVEAEAVVEAVQNEPKRTNELDERREFRAVRICKDFHRKNLDAHLKVCNNTVMQTNKTVCIR